jgi:hypothetical protein
MKFTRDDWMVISRALQDRVAALENTDGFGAGTLRFHEAEKCKRLRTVIDAHVDATWVAPKTNKVANG